MKILLDEFTTLLCSIAVAALAMFCMAACDVAVSTTKQPVQASDPGEKPAVKESLTTPAAQPAAKPETPPTELNFVGLMLTYNFISSDCVGRTTTVEAYEECTTKAVECVSAAKETVSPKDIRECVKGSVE